MVRVVAVAQLVLVRPQQRLALAASMVAAARRLDIP